MSCLDDIETRPVVLGDAKRDIELPPVADSTTYTMVVTLCRSAGIDSVSRLVSILHGLRAVVTSLFFSTTGADGPVVVVQVECVEYRAARRIADRLCRSVYAITVKVSPGDDEDRFE